MKAKVYFKEQGLAPVVVAIFEEMCKRVGVNLEDLELAVDAVHPSKYIWVFDDYSWSEDEESAFAEWLVEYMYKNRKELELPFYTKKSIRESVVPMWLLQYSWRTA